MSAKNELKRYQKAKFENFKKINDLKINDDEAYIDIKIKDFNSIISDYSVSTNPILKKELYSYIEHSASYIPLDYPLVLEIHSEKLNSEEKILLRNLIKNHFSLTKIEKEMELNALKRKSFFFLFAGLVGFIIIAILIYNPYHDVLSFFKEILLFIASFSVWEFGELYFFEQDDLKEEVIKYTHLSKVRIVYNKDNS